MKKSFLQTFIVLGIFAIFLCGSFVLFSNKVGAVGAVPGSTGTVVPGGFNAVSPEAREAAKVQSTGFWDGIAQGTIMPLIQTSAVFGLKLIQFGMWIAGGVFDEIIKATILDQTFFKSMDPSILAAWKIVRDIANILIVFSLLYLGIKTILNGNGFAETKVLISIIIAAILINFSLLATKVVFETSNFVGAKIGEQITFTGQSTGYSGVRTISEGVMGMVRPDLIMNELWNDKAQSGWEVMWGRVQVAVITGITMLMIVAIFVGASWLLFYRFMLFVVLMITSPVGLISKLVPWFNNVGEWWWKTIKTQAIVLPVFLLTFYVSLLFVGPLSTNLRGGAFVGTTSVGSAQTASAGAVTFFFNYLLIIGFLLLPLIVPGKVGAAGSSLMTDAAGWTTKKIKAMPRRTAVLTGRAAASTSARAGRYLGGSLLAKSLGGRTEQQQKDLKLKAQGTGAGAWFAQQKLRASEGLKNQTYDVRNLGVVKGTKFGKEMGKGIEGWSSTVKKKKEDYEKKKKDEMKLFGFDRAHETVENKIKIEEAEDARDAQATKLQKAKDSLKEAKTNNLGSAIINLRRQNVDKHEKELKKQEAIVGEFKNIGDVEYTKQLKNKLVTRVRNISRTNAGALESMQEDMKKKWEKSGMSSQKKRDEARNARTDRTLSGPTPPSPTPPTP